MGIEDKLLIIRRNDFLAQLTDADYESLNIAHNFITAAKQEYIYFDAGYHNKLYFVKDGYVKIGNVDEEGNDIVREILQPGDVFGQFTLERSNMPGEYAQAYKKDVSLCAFTIADFERLLQSKPQLAVHFSKKVGQRLRHIENRLVNLLQKDVRMRLLFFFRSLMGERDTAGAACTIANYLTHEDIARLIGASRQTVTTLISQFEEGGMIAVDRKNITILDVKKLIREAKVG